MPLWILDDIEVLSCLMNQAEVYSDSLKFFVTIMSQSRTHNTVDARMHSVSSHFVRLFFIFIMICVLGTSNAHAFALGNFDGDIDVDVFDLMHFTTYWLASDCGNPDWCGGTDINRSTTVDMADLMIISGNWQKRSTKVVHSNNSPKKLAFGPQGNIYVTDDKAGSVFIYDPNLVVTGQLRGLGKPLGIAVDDQGSIYIGNTATKSVEKYNSYGVKQAVIATGIKLPTDLKIDDEGNLYVTDSTEHKIRVFDPNHVELISITTEDMKYPTAIEIDYVDDGTGKMVVELYVASYVTEKNNPTFIRVFDLQGNLKRNFGVLAPYSMMGGGGNWYGKFLRVQGLQIGPDGNLHVLDSGLNRVQTFNRITGSHIGVYSEPGEDPGQLNLPLNMLIDQAGRVIVANHRNKRVEVIHTLP